MILVLKSRNEVAGNDKVQLQFLEETETNAAETGMMYPPSPTAIQLMGWFDRSVALTFTVGASYNVTLTKVTK